jgi:hypothetical protein
MRSATETRNFEIRHAVAIALAAAALTAFQPGVLHAQAAEETKEAAESTEGKSEAASDSADVTNLSTIQVVEDPLRAVSNEPSASSFGFSKPILETPRTVSFVSEEQINLFGISAVEDLTRAVPGTYTTTRYGLQGGINVRGVSADMYYRGMKRLNMQGHVRTVLSAMDGIEGHGQDRRLHEPHSESEPREVRHIPAEFQRLFARNGRLVQPLRSAARRGRPVLAARQAGRLLRIRPARRLRIVREEGRHRAAVLPGHVEHRECDRPVPS